MNYKQNIELPPDYLRKKIAEFLIEDAPRGDVTSLGTIPQSSTAICLVEAEEDLYFAGKPLIDYFFGDAAQKEIFYNDGDFVPKSGIIAKIRADVHQILLHERVFLNLLQRLCGIATLTRKYVEIAREHSVKILDTRKTTPGMRLFEKYAVAAGGGTNHRLDLSSGILIKDNHIKAAGGIITAVEKMKKAGSGLLIELEVDTFEQIDEGLRAGVDGFLLDNMSPEKVTEAVKKIRSHPQGKDIFIEASGGITLETLKDYVITGIDAVSVGALTHSVKCSNIHLEFCND